jgi:catabolite regulation protein CreA
MRQVKRFFYFVLLNIVISAVTVIVVLQLWERDHPSLSAENTPVVVIVTPTQSVILPLMANNSGSDEITGVDSGVPITGTYLATPMFALLSYQVKEGDTLGALAIQFNVSVADIMTVNGFTDPDSINVGQVILIPTAPLPTITPTSIPPTVYVSPTPRPSVTSTHGPTPTTTPTPIIEEAQMRIESVIGVGVLETERVELLRTGDGELSLAGWRLEDGTGVIYTFPDLTLYTGGKISLNTRTGQDTVVDLFWGLTSPMWRSGKTVSLYDAQNELRSSYTVP